MNDSNKQQLLDLLSIALEAAGNTVHKCLGNADTLIVSMVQDFACLTKSVVRHETDTYIFIMLI